MEMQDVAQRFAPEVSVREYVSMLLRHKLLFVLVAAMVIASAGVWTFLTPSEFQSTAAVVLRTNTNQQLFPSVGSSQRSQFVRQPAAELEYASSTFFASRADELIAPTASVRPVYEESNTFNSQSSQIQFVATAPDPIDAQQAANAWAQHYLDTRAANDVAENEATVQGLEAQIADLELEKDELLSPIQPIDDALLAETDADAISRLTTQRLSLRQSLEDELLPLTLQLRTLSQDLSNLRIAADYVERPDNSARMSIEAPLGRQIAPRVSRNMALASILALMAATGVVLAYESFLGVINTASDLESLAPNVPVLSRLPEFPRGTDAPLALAAEPGSTYAQSLERVVSTLLYQRVQLPGRRMTVLFTSAVPGEGKTTVASHLAMRLGATPTDTILIDADLRRPDIHTSFGFDQPKPGLSHLLATGQPLAPHVRRIQRLPRVRVLCAGAATDDAASLLRQSFAHALDTLPSYDLLLIDAPPVLAVTDAEVMSRSVDGVVLIVRAGRTTRAQLAETLRKLREAHATVLGFVLVAAVSNAANGYSNSYHYEIDETTERLAQARRDGGADPARIEVPTLLMDPEPIEPAEVRELIVPVVTAPPVAVVADPPPKVSPGTSPKRTRKVVARSEESADPAAPTSGGGKKSVSTSGGAKKSVSTSGDGKKSVSTSGGAKKSVSPSGGAKKSVSTSGGAKKSVSPSGGAKKSVSTSGGAKKSVSVSPAPKATFAEAAAAPSQAAKRTGSERKEARRVNRERRTDEAWADPLTHQTALDLSDRE